MNAREIVAEIEFAGGVFTLDGGDIAYEIPPKVKPLLSELRARKTEVLEILRSREPVDIVRRFDGQPHAKLFPFIGRKVRTQNGAGTLIQVFAERVTVVLDSDVCACAFFEPADKWWKWFSYPKFSCQKETFMGCKNHPVEPEIRFLDGRVERFIRLPLTRWQRLTEWDALLIAAVLAVIFAVIVGLLLKFTFGL